MMNRFAAAAPLLCLLAAGSSLAVRPGKWETTVTILDMDMPGVPAGILAMMRKKPTTFTTCVTPEQAAAGPKSVLQNTKGKCHYTRFNAVGGKFDAAMECSAGSGTMTTVSSGTYTDTTMDVTGSGTMTGPRGMSTKSHSIGRYIGPC